MCFCFGASGGCGVDERVGSSKAQLGYETDRIEIASFEMQCNAVVSRRLDRLSLGDHAASCQANAWHTLAILAA